MRSLLSLALVSVLLAGCRSSLPPMTPTPTSIPALTTTSTPAFPLPEGKIIFDVSETRKFAGNVYGQGETGIILANMSYGGQGKWAPFIEAFDRDRFTAVAFDWLRPDYTGASQDISVVFKKMRASGYTRIICIGASLGVTACGSLARHPEIAGIVMIAGPNYGAALSSLSYPKLFIAGQDDPWSVETNNAFKGAGEPKELVLFPGVGNHGTDLFTSTVRDQFLQLLLDFVNSVP